MAAAVSTLFTALATLFLKITFGRSADGFHPFHFGTNYWAFPSGHTACTLSVTVVFQAAFPRWRVFWWALAGIVGASLIALTYHYVGDVLGGAFLGWAIGGTVARLIGPVAAGRSATLDGKAGRSATLDGKAGRSATLDGKAGRSATPVIATSPAIPPLTPPVGTLTGS